MERANHKLVKIVPTFPTQFSHGIEMQTVRDRRSRVPMWDGVVESGLFAGGVLTTALLVLVYMVKQTTLSVL